MDTTLKIAIYGALVSTIMAIKQILDYYRDRADIKIWVKGGYKYFPETAVYKDKIYIRVDVSNRGRRPTTITSCALRIPKKHKKEPLWLLIGDSARNPKRLLEGESQTYMAEEDEIKKYNLIDKDLVVCAIDATGKYYWADNVFIRWIKLIRCGRKMKNI